MKKNDFLPGGVFLTSGDDPAASQKLTLAKDTALVAQQQAQTVMPQGNIGEVDVMPTLSAAMPVEPLPSATAAATTAAADTPLTPSVITFPVWLWVIVAAVILFIIYKMVSTKKSLPDVIVNIGSNLKDAIPNV